MSNSKILVFRTVYIDIDIDNELRTLSFDKSIGKNNNNKISKNDLFCECLSLGIKAAPQLIALQKKNNLVLRTLYIDPIIDKEIEKQAHHTKISKNDIMRQYIRLGMTMHTSTIMPSILQLIQ